MLKKYALIYNEKYDISLKYYHVKSITNLLNFINDNNFSDDVNVFITSNYIVVCMFRLLIKEKRISDESYIYCMEDAKHFFFNKDGTYKGNEIPIYEQKLKSILNRLKK